ncbi:MAG: hypothetical protein P8188_09630 [Gemmatimonadota bacterium]
MADESQQAGKGLGYALAGGGASATVFLLAAVGIGRVGDRQAMSLLESTLPTIRFLCSSAIGSAATVLALMVTLLGLSQRFDSDVRPRYFRRIRHISGLCVSVMVGGIGLLLLLTVPLSESEEFVRWYNAIYYGVLVVASLLGGGLVAMTLALRKAVGGLLSAAHPDAESAMFLDRATESVDEGTPNGKDDGGTEVRDEAQASSGRS